MLIDAHSHIDRYEESLELALKEIRQIQNLFDQQFNGHPIV